MNDGLRRRRPGRVVIGLVAVAVGAWVFAASYVSAGTRVEVVAMASSVQRHHRIDRSDLRVVRIGVTGIHVRIVPASRLDDLVGGVATLDLSPGTLLAPGLIGDPGERVVADDEAVVSIVVPAGSYPSGRRRGDRVVLAMRPEDGSDGHLTNEVDGWLVRTDRASLSNGDQPVEVAVARTQVASLAVAAMDDRVTLVALAR